MGGCEPAEGMMASSGAIQTEPNSVTDAAPRSVPAPKGREACKWELLLRRRLLTGALVIARKNANTEYAVLIRKARAR